MNRGSAVTEVAPDFFDGTEACSHVEDPEIFWVKRYEDAVPAKSVCSLCPLRTRCLEWAIDTNQKSGVWGGTTAMDRRRIRKRREASR